MTIRFGAIICGHDCVNVREKYRQSSKQKSFETSERHDCQKGKSTYAVLSKICVIFFLFFFFGSRVALVKSLEANFALYCIQR